MIRDKHNIIPMFLACAVHGGIVAALIVAVDFTRDAYPAVPLAMTATLVTEVETPPPPPVVEPEPEPEPAGPTEDEIRRQQEEEKRQADLRAEQERIRLQQEADRQRREQEEAERRRLREEEVERQRQEAERRRLEEVERQRQENLRLRREAEQAEIVRRRQAEIDAEANRIEAMEADDTARWVFRLQQAIARNFVLPASAPPDLECVVDIRQTGNGDVISVAVGRCNGDASVRRAIEAAVHKASPLPSPENPAVFERDLQITFKPEQ